MVGLRGERNGDKQACSQAFRVGPGWLTAGAALLMAGVGCRAPATIGDAAILSRELRTEFHRPVAVVLDGQHRLIVTLEASSTDSASSDSTVSDSSTSDTPADPAAQAYQVAKFVGAHYQHVGALKTVTVILEPAATDSAGEPTTSIFSAADINPTPRPAVAPGTKSD
jgi:hypothetical protein